MDVFICVDQTGVVLCLCIYVNVCLCVFDLDGGKEEGGVCTR